MPVLTLFDGGTGAGVGSGDAGSSGGSSAGSSPAGTDKGVKVIYGKQDTSGADAQGNVGTASSGDTGSDAGSDIAVGSDEAFDALIKGEYRDAFNRRVKTIVDRRTKGREELARYKSDTEELVGMLAERYGVDASNVTALTAAIKSDDSFFEEAAEAEGLTVDQYKYKLHIERENKRLQAFKERAEAERAARERVETWEADAVKVAELYPGFDFDTESANPDFARLLRAGVDVKTAYEVVHNDEIVSGAIRMTAKAVARQVTDGIRARGMRPAESGAGSQAAVVVKNDVHNLSREDRAEIVRRARRGEKIKF